MPYQTRRCLLSETRLLSWAVPLTSKRLLFPLLDCSNGNAARIPPPTVTMAWLVALLDFYRLMQPCRNRNPIVFYDGLNRVDPELSCTTWADNRNHHGERGDWCVRWHGLKAMNIR